MWFRIGLFYLCCLAVANASCPKEDKVVACYYAGWGIYREGNGTFKIDYINSNLCTHLIYSFAGINLNGVIDSLDYTTDVTYAGYKSFNALKENNPCLKTLLAIGGWNEGSEKYSLVAETQDRREKFTESVLNFLCYFGFDGLDIDWEYPTQRGGITDDRENYILLLQTLKQGFDKRHKILTVAIGAPPSIVNLAYDVKEMCATVDFVMVMAYDLQTPNVISAHAPLKRESMEASSRVVIEDCIKNLITEGCAADKIVLGIGAFGRSYTMKSESLNNINNEAAGLGEAGPYSKEKGSMGFNEICEIVNRDKWTKKYLSNNAITYAYKNDQWISYDDQQSVINKAKYALQAKLKGMMLYSIDTDDFHGDCFKQSFPLLNAINSGLNRKVQK